MTGPGAGGMDDGEPTVELDLEVVKITRWVLLVGDGNREAWLPKSLLRPFNDDVDDYEGGESATLTVPEWLAIREELV